MSTADARDAPTGQGPKHPERTGRAGSETCPFLLPRDAHTDPGPARQGRQSGLKRCRACRSCRALSDTPCEGSAMPELPFQVLTEETVATPDGVVGLPCEGGRNDEVGLRIAPRFPRHERKQRARRRLSPNVLARQGRGPDHDKVGRAPAKPQCTRAWSCGGPQQRTAERLTARKPDRASRPAPRPRGAALRRERKAKGSSCPARSGGVRGPDVEPSPPPLSHLAASLLGGRMDWAAFNSGPIGKAQVVDADV